MGHSKHLLNIQYRMQPSISRFPNSKFYFNQILDGPNVKDRSYVQGYLPGPMFGSYSFISVSGGREQSDTVGRSLKNLVEVAVMSKIVQNLYKGILELICIIRSSSLDIDLIFYLCIEVQHVICREVKDQKKWKERGNFDMIFCI